MSNILPEMIPISPLGGKEPMTDAHGPVTLSEAIDSAIASFACRLGHEKAAQKSVEKYVGFTLPEPGSMASNETFSAFWTGQSQWMILAPHSSHENLSAQIQTAAKETASVTEQNDAWCRFDLSGEGLVEVFELLCPINIRKSVDGTATRTSIDHLGCFVLLHSKQNISVLGPRSSAGSLHHALLTAMRAAH